MVPDRRCRAADRLTGAFRGACNRVAGSWAFDVAPVSQGCGATERPTTGIPPATQAETLCSRLPVLAVRPLLRHARGARRPGSAIVVRPHAPLLATGLP